MKTKITTISILAVLAITFIAGSVSAAPPAPGKQIDPWCDGSSFKLSYTETAGDGITTVLVYQGHSGSSILRSVTMPVPSRYHITYVTRGEVIQRHGQQFIHWDNIGQTYGQSAGIYVKITGPVNIGRIQVHLTTDDSACLQLTDGPK